MKKTCLQVQPKETKALLPTTSSCTWFALHLRLLHSSICKILNIINKINFGMCTLRSSITMSLISKQMYSLVGHAGIYWSLPLMGYDFRHLYSNHNIPVNSEIMLMKNSEDLIRRQLYKPEVCIII